MNDPPGRLVRVHPGADLVEGELEQAQVDDVPRVGTDLHAVPHFERAAPEDECPPGQVRNRVLEGDRQPRRDEAEDRREIAHTGEPHPADDDDAGCVQHVSEGFPPAVTDPRVVHTPVDHRQDDAVHDP